MADPPVTELSPEATAKFQEYTAAVKGASAANETFESTIGKVQDVMSGLSKQLGQVGAEMQKAGHLSEAGAAQFQLIATGAINVRKSFESFDGVKGLSTFGGQIASIKEALGSGQTTASVAVEGLKKGLLAMHVPQAVIDSVKGGVDGLMKFADQQVKSADNALKLSAAYMHQMAATGSLSKAYEQGGDDLNNINIVMDRQAKMIANVGSATNKLPQDVEAAFGSFMKIPGALNSVVDGATKSGEKLSGLTAIMKLADGTHRNFEDVNNDVAKAIKGFTGNVDDSQKHMGEAMQFTQRYSELSKNLKISIDDVRTSLGTATDSMMKYTNANGAALKMGMGVQNIMNEYAGGLMKAGMTGKQAADSVTHMTDAFGGLNTAQKAFLSAQTGGPGGLMGAAQIEKMIRTGDIEGVKKRVMEVMKKQFGTVVTQEEATKSEAAAGQFTKQKLLLQQGPLGQLAKSDTEAAQMLDMFKGKETGKDTAGGLGKADKGLQEAISKGSKWEEKSTGFLGQIVQTTNATALALGATNLTLTQNALGSTSTGDMTKEKVDTARDAERQLNKEFMERGTKRGGTDATKFLEESGPSANKIRENQKDALSEDLIAAKNAPAAIGRALSTEGNLAATAFKGAPKRQAPETLIQDEINSARQRATKPPARPSQSLISKGAMPSLDIKNFGQTTNPGAMVGAAQRGPTAPKGAPGAGAVPTVTVEESGSSSSFNVKVKVEVNDKEVGSHAKGINPAVGTD